MVYRGVTVYTYIGFTPFSMSFEFISFNVAKAALANVEFSPLLIFIDVEIKNRLEDLRSTEFTGSFLLADKLIQMLHCFYLTLRQCCQWHIDAAVTELVRSLAWKYIALQAIDFFALGT